MACKPLTCEPEPQVRQQVGPGGGAPEGQHDGGVGPCQQHFSVLRSLPQQLKLLQPAQLQPESGSSTACNCSPWHRCTLRQVQSWSLCTMLCCHLHGGVDGDRLVLVVFLFKPDHSDQLCLRGGRGHAENAAIVMMHRIARLQLTHLMPVDLHGSRHAASAGAKHSYSMCMMHSTKGFEENARTSQAHGGRTSIDQ